MAVETGAEETERRIVAAALKLFGQVGYTRASTRRIADEAGVNEVTLFRHFGSKQNLLLACIKSGNQAGFAQTFRQHLTGEYTADIHVLARLQMADTRQKLEVLRLLLCDAQAVPDLQEALVMGASDNRDSLAAYFSEQIATGAVRSDLNPLVLAHGFDSLFSSYLLFEHITGSDLLAAVPPDEVLHSLASMFIQGTQAE